MSTTLTKIEALKTMAVEAIEQAPAKPVSETAAEAASRLAATMAAVTTAAMMAAEIRYEGARAAVIIFQAPDLKAAVEAAYRSVASRAMRRGTAAGAGDRLRYLENRAEDASAAVEAAEEAVDAAVVAVELIDSTTAENLAGFAGGINASSARKGVEEAIAVAAAGLMQEACTNAREDILSNAREWADEFDPLRV